MFLEEMLKTHKIGIPPYKLLHLVTSHSWYSKINLERASLKEALISPIISFSLI